MTRPRKATVDYFPHDTSHGKTIFLLESRWGNDGYAVWFKVLEHLGSSHGHFIDCREPMSLAFLAAHARVSESTLLEILDTLAAVTAIDRDLWRQKLIYSQNFVDRVADAYRRRKESLPNRETVIAVSKVGKKGFLPSDIPLNEVTDGRNPQRERERERERERKDTSSSSSLTQEIETEGPEPTAVTEKMTRKEFSDFYIKTFNRMMPGLLNEESAAICNRYPAETIREAFRIGAEKGAGSWSYIKAVLEGKGQKSDPMAFLDDLCGGGTA